GKGVTRSTTPRIDPTPAEPTITSITGAPPIATPIQQLSVPTVATLDGDGSVERPPVEDHETVVDRVTPLPDNPEQDDALVRRVLDRYAAAYSQLDAEAAQQVWPGVNRTALARAFDDLQSQQVSLGSCRIDVQGDAARAACAGMATWSPKIGDRTLHTESRRWNFELAKSGPAWQIVSAQVGLPR
ncbi:MAG: hypothetical protein ACRD1V_01245, partial [Vicinamibacterales bacterium]